MENQIIRQCNEDDRPEKGWKKAEANQFKATFYRTIGRFFSKIGSFLKRHSLPFYHWFEVTALVCSFEYMFHDQELLEIIDKVDREWQENPEKMHKQVEEENKKMMIRWRRYLQKIGLYETDLQVLTKQEFSLLMDGAHFLADNTDEIDQKFISKIRTKYSLPIRDIPDSWVLAGGDYE